MGLFHSSKVHTSITGRDKKTGKVVYSTSDEGMGFTGGAAMAAEDKISKLQEEYPDVDWEYEVMKE